MLHRLQALRRAHTASHADYSLPLWPKQPTPHQIFNISAAETEFANRLEFDKSLKLTYQKYVKLYHPDTQHAVSDASSVLTAEQKRQRFDQIQHAYDILKNPKSRLAYNKSQNTSWADYNDNASSFEAYRMANAHRQQYNYDNDPRFWEAATWEDYYKMRYGRPPPTMAEFEANKWRILWRVLAVASVAVVLQLCLVWQRKDEFNRQTRLMNLRAGVDMDAAYSNYDFGQLRLERIRRFLMFRRLALEERDNEDARTEEHEMLVKYAQAQVAKWED